MRTTPDNITLAVEGRESKFDADAERPEGDDDVAGHVYVKERDDRNGQRLR